MNIDVIGGSIKPDVLAGISTDGKGIVKHIEPVPGGEISIDGHCPFLQRRRYHYAFTDQELRTDLIGVNVSREGEEERSRYRDAANVSLVH